MRTISHATYVMQRVRLYCSRGRLCEGTFTLMPGDGYKMVLCPHSGYAIVFRPLCSVSRLHFCKRSVIVCLGTNGKRLLTGTRCPLECPNTRSRPAGITVRRLKFSRRRHKHRKWITFSVFSFSFLCVSSKMLNFKICCVGSSQWSGFASRFFSFFRSSPFSTA